MSKPIIGITGNILKESKAPFSGYKRAYVNDDYVKSIINSNGIPFIIPINQNKEVIRSQIELCDAIIISGGYDVDPRFYNQEPHILLQETFVERDLFEMEVIKICLELNKPILGICRGLQILNVALGGSLYQDNSLKSNNIIKHVQNSDYKSETHNVTINKDSILYNILGEKIMVNSFHHMSIKDVADDLKVIATSSDGIIEAVQHKEKNNIFAVQWHPEMLQDSKNQQNIFKYFVKLSSKESED